MVLLKQRFSMGHFYGEQTIGVRNSMHSIHDDATPIAHLAKLKATENMSAMSFTSRNCFNRLYDEARELIAKMYNEFEDTEYEEAVQEDIHKLALNYRLFDAET